MPSDDFGMAVISVVFLIAAVFAAIAWLVTG